MHNQTYRNTDPITSRQPVANKPKLQAIALKLISDNPGITAGEIEARAVSMGLGSGLWKRLNELEKKSMISRDGYVRFNGTGRLQTKWKIKEQQLGIEEML